MVALVCILGWQPSQAQIGIGIDDIIPLKVSQTPAHTPAQAIETSSYQFGNQHIATLAPAPALSRVAARRTPADGSPLADVHPYAWFSLAWWQALLRWF
ncbi:MAG: hypothetical protein OHK0039_36800 [Bacteroidia bacterium]